ncbi:MAG: MATE family efflux transporter [Faecousia sp.]
MKQNHRFFRTVCNLAVPVALQSMLQSSFSMIDQIMIGQLGSVSIAGVGLAGKFSSIYTVLVSGIGAVAGIMISQYLGQKKTAEVRRSFSVNLTFSLLLAAAFTLLCVCFPKGVMGLYTTDGATLQAAASYLAVIAGTFLPIAGATMLSTMFRCMEKASLPLYASICAALTNTGLNYVLIFGKLGFRPMGAEGAAAATVCAQLVNLLIMLGMYLRLKKRMDASDGKDRLRAGFPWRRYAAILLPLLACEFLWSFGENVYAGIYSHMGTDASAAMTLINPIQGLMIGALCGLSQAAGVIVGKCLGEGSYDEAYDAAKKLILYGLTGAAVLSVVIVLISPYYVQLYRVEPEVKALTRQILLAYALIAPFKVLNMIAGGGILRSGGKTGYVLAIDLLGTWGFGVPLGLLTAFVFKLSVPYVYFILSLEECVRFAVSIAVLRSRKWMHRLEA